MEEIPQIKPMGPREETPSGAPPPPSEVKIRTMKSDIETMAHSGGGLPRFQNIKVSGLSLEREEQAPSLAHKKNAIIIVLITVIAVVVLGVLIYFAYNLLASPAGH